MPKTRSFKFDKFHTEIVAKSTMFKVLKYLDRDDLQTPFLLLDGDKVRAKIALIGSKIRNSTVFYAVKANPDIETIKLVEPTGIGFEIASDGELRLLQTLGVAPERIITSNPVKSIKFIKVAYDYGIRFFAYDSYAEVDKMAQHAPGSSVYLRLSVPNEGSEWPLSKKFGVEPDQALALLEYARNKGLIPIGLTFHVGSQCLNKFSWNTAILKARSLWDMALERGIQMKVLNIGGGYPVMYTKSVVGIEEIERNIDAVIAEQFPEGVEVYIEPGRGLVGDAGVFVSTVHGKAMRGERQWVYIDVGVFNGLMESVGGIKYTYMVENIGQIIRNVECTLGGPSCDSFDVITEDAVLAGPELGCLVLILAAGAYTISYASEFNGFSIPKTIII